MRCFLCLTPYNIFNAIALQQETGETADIIIYDRHTGHTPQDFLPALRSSGIFDRVMFVNGVDRSKWKNGNKEFAKNCLRLLSRYEKMMPRGRYDELLIPFYNDYDLLIWKAAGQHRAGRVTVYEEGEGTYVLPPLEAQWHGRAGKRLAMVLRDDDIRHVDSVRLYAPRMAQPAVKNRVISMPRVNEGRMREACRKVFGTTGDECPYRALFIGGGACPEDIENRIAALAEGDEFPRFAVKPHPKRVNEFDGRATRIVSGRQPLEAMYSMIGDLDERVLVASKSTSLITPKTIYGKEPYIVALSEIPEIDAIMPYADGWRNMMDELREMYDDPGKIFLPHTVDEAIGTIKELLA